MSKRDEIIAENDLGNGFLARTTIRRETKIVPRTDSFKNEIRIRDKIIRREMYRKTTIGPITM